MQTFFLNFEIFICIAVILATGKIAFPTYTYTYKFSLIVWCIGICIFAFQLISISSNIDVEQTIDAVQIVSCVVSLAICSFTAYLNGRQLTYKTMTIVVSRVTNKAVGVIGPGIGSIDPWFEITAKPISLKAEEVRIKETPWMQTGTRGILARILEISIMLQCKGNSDSKSKGNSDPKSIISLYNIVGGVETVIERIKNFADEFFLDEVGVVEAQKLDTGRKKFREAMRIKLEKEINHFCCENGYPYIVKQILIGDTELSKQYYDALAELALTILRENALNKSAEMTGERVRALGKVLLPTGSESQQFEAAQITLKEIKKTIEDKKFGVDADMAKLIKLIVPVLFKSRK